MRTAGISVVSATIAALLLGPNTAEPQAQGSATWKPAVYHGLTVGKSVRADVLRIFGKPLAQGKGGETVLPYVQYTVPDPVPGRLTVYFSRGVIRQMHLTPDHP